MVNLIKNQSGMDFIADNTFHIEESTIYTNIGDSIKTVEFIRTKEVPVLESSRFPLKTGGLIRYSSE